MGAFEKLKDFFSFTSNEKKIFLLIAILFLAGIIFKISNRSFITSSSKNYDYTTSDSIFFARSEMIQTGEKSSDSKQNSKSKKLLTEKININKAIKSKLMQLPGVGESTAEKIILYRDNEGPFKKIEEIQNIKGIGPNKFEKLKSFIIVD